MRITVVAGLPGTGKTHYRQEHLAAVPYLDMADLRKQMVDVAGIGYEGWRESMHLLFNQLFNEQQMDTPHLVVEGIFEPNSASLKWLLGFCADHEIEVEIVRVTADFQVLLGRLVDDFNSDGDMERLVARTYLAAKYAGGF
jgi:predicted kinase